MNDFLSEYCHKNDKKVNPDLFNRSFDKPLVDYVLSTIKNLEVFDAIRLVSYEFITDQSKIENRIDKTLKKDTKIKNNRALEKIVSSSDQLYDLLVLHFRVSFKGQVENVTRRMLIPKCVRGHYIKGGNRFVNLIQIVDNSTFVKKNVINFKTTMYPLKIYPTPITLKFIDEEVIKTGMFTMDIFQKEANPLYFFFAKYGVQDTLELFNVGGIMSIVNDIIDEDNYMYLKIKDGIYLEVHEKGFHAHPFIPNFFATVANILSSDAKNITFKSIYTEDYWLGRLSTIYYKNPNIAKGRNILTSFTKLIDPYTMYRLKLPKFHKKNTFRIVRWMMVNYAELMKKDSNDLKNKRMRANEIQAYYLDTYLANQVYRILKSDNPTIDTYIKLLGKINENALQMAASGKGSSATAMQRSERYNDFDALNMVRYTLKGPTGINGGKHKTSDSYRDIYPSHIGRYDINFCSAQDPGLTGYLCINNKFDNMGNFDENYSEPDAYDPIIDKILSSKSEPDYAEIRKAYIQNQLYRDETGFITLKRKKSNDEINEEFRRNPWKYGLYRLNGELRIMPKLMGVDSKGVLTLKRKQKSNGFKVKNVEYRDANGFMVLKRKGELKLNKMTDSIKDKPERRRRRRSKDL